MTEPTIEELQAALLQLASQARVYEGEVYRSTSPKYAKADQLLTGEGSRLHAGRWNPKGLAMVYTSLTPETAMAETLAHQRYYGLPVADAMPRTFVSFRVKLGRVLDMRDPQALQTLQMVVADIVDLDWRQQVKAGQEPVTQRLARLAFADKWEALLVPSAADPAGHNLLVFPENLEPTSQLTIVRAEQLT